MGIQLQYFEHHVSGVLQFWLLLVMNVIGICFWRLGMDSQYGIGYLMLRYTAFSNCVVIVAPKYSPRIPGTIYHVLAKNWTACITRVELNWKIMQGMNAQK